ncbi:MAG: glycosyltransferase, partial [Cyanobacteria bacterium]|nr:glycosyltransferase [Cyanobacteriota bacterium]
MPQGHQINYVQFYRSPSIEKPLPEIFQLLDSFTGEDFEGDPGFEQNIFSVVVLPPVESALTTVESNSPQSHFVKGILFSTGVDYLVKTFPQMKHLFHTIAFSLQPSYPWSKEADAYFVMYQNQTRMKWFRETYPERADKILLPFEWTDFLNENVFIPLPDIKKEIDILCVSRLETAKNLKIICEALMDYRRLYNTPIKMTYIPGLDLKKDNFGNFDTDSLQPWESPPLLEMIHIFKNRGESIHDYVDVILEKQTHQQLTGYYNRAKLTVIGSLIEGRCRVLFESASCNTPVVCFRAYNQYARGEDPNAFPPGAGLYAPEFTSQSLAETWHKILSHHVLLEPRKSLLAFGCGRANFLNQCIDRFPYYETHLPGYEKASNHFHNPWLNKAMVATYQK